MAIMSSALALLVQVAILVAAVAAVVAVADTATIVVGGEGMDHTKE